MVRLVQSVGEVANTRSHVFVAEVYGGPHRALDVGILIAGKWYGRRYGMGLVSSVAFVRQMLESCDKRAEFPRMRNLWMMDS